MQFHKKKEYKNYFNSNLFYVIVSGNLAEDYFNKYARLKEKEGNTFLAAIIVYCFDLDKHKSKPYNNDIFFNSGIITNDFKEVVEYILKDETNWNNRMGIEYKANEIKDEELGNVFINVDSSKHYELVLPALIGTLINCSLLDEDDIFNFQKKCLNVIIIKIYLKQYFLLKKRKYTFLYISWPNIFKSLHY